MRWLTILLGSFLGTAQAQQFVPRSENRLHEGTELYYFLGRNAYYFMTAAAPGEEGFDIGVGGYQGPASAGWQWLFNGSAGVGFSRNTAISAIDFGSIHLYPEVWGMPNSAGNAWSRDHIAVAGAWGKPLIIGEFGVRFEKAQTYDSWLSTIVLDGAAGGLGWQLLDGTGQDAEGSGIQCPGSDPVRPILRLYAGQFETKS